MRKSKKIYRKYKSRLSRYNKHKRRHNNKTKTSKYKKYKFYYNGGGVTLAEVSTPFIPYAGGEQVGDAHAELSQLQMQGAANATTDKQ